MTRGQLTARRQLAARGQVAAPEHPAAPEPRLDPVRWRGPGRGTVLRAALAAMLLVTAAGVLYAGDRSPSSTPPGPGSIPAAGDPVGGAPPGDPGVAGTPGVPAGEPRGTTGTPGVPASEPRGTTGTPGPPAEAAGSGQRAASGRDRPRSPVPPGLVGVPVRLAEASALAVLRPGDRIDLVAVPPDGGRSTVVATRALILDVVGDPDPDGLPGTAVYLALTRAQAQRTVGAVDGARFAALVHP